MYIYVYIDSLGRTLTLARPLNSNHNPTLTRITNVAIVIVIVITPTRCQKGKRGLTKGI